MDWLYITIIVLLMFLMLSMLLRGVYIWGFSEGAKYTIDRIEERDRCYNLSAPPERQ